MLSYLAANGDLTGAIAAIERAGSSTVAAAMRENDFIYPYFGERRERTVLLVEHQGGNVPRSATWLVAAPARRSSDVGVGNASTTGTDGS